LCHVNITNRGTKGNIMAQMKQDKAADPEGLLLPVQFRASIQRVADTTQIGDWIVGFFPPDEMGSFPKDELETETTETANPYGIPQAQEIDLGEEQETPWFVAGDEPRRWEFDRLPVEWLTSYLGIIREHSEVLSKPSPAPDTVMRSLLRSGTFRENDWVDAERISHGSARVERIPALPAEVREEIGRLNVRHQKRVYVLRIDDFWLEWRLLESLAVLAGVLSQRGSIISARPEAERAWSLLGQLRCNTYSHKPQKMPAVPRSRSLAEHIRMMIRDVVREAFWRVIQKPSTMFLYETHGPSLAIEARSVLSVAYLVLLRYFSRGWKRCKRPDCQKLFPITDDARKVFCSQYCGHLESLRKKRGTKKSTSHIPQQRRKP
jgi:hypothetical protein